MFLCRKPSITTILNTIAHPIDGKNWLAFQIQDNGNRIETKSPSLGASTVNWNKDWLAFFSVFAIFACLTSTIAPGVNESHYLTKAKHFWNPDWCGNDIFLNSSNAHQFFFVTCGWPTLFLSLDAVAWIGRSLCWFAAAIAWVRLNQTVGIRTFYSPVTATMFVLLIERFDMAGEWVIGGFEAKSVAYVFVLWSINFLLQKRLDWCLGFVGAAIAFHAVVGVWTLACVCGTILVSAVSAGMLSDLKDSLLTRNFGFAVIAFVVFSAVGCVPPLAANWGLDTELFSAANEIQVHQRLSHHLLFSSFPASYVARFLLLVLIFTFLFQLCRNFKKLHWLNLFGLFSLLISLAGIYLSGLTEAASPSAGFANSLLRFYWFRFSDFAIPLSLSLSAGFFAQLLMASSNLPKQRVAWFSICCLFAASLLTVFEGMGDFRPGADRATLPNYPDSRIRTTQTYENWKKACTWIRENTNANGLFLTPYHFQTFKWHAHRAEFACWKDAPQDAKGIVEWRNRIGVLQYVEQIPGGWLNLDDELYQYACDNQITHVLAHQSDEDFMLQKPQHENLSNDQRLARVYPIEVDARSTFVIYKLNRIDADTPN